MSKKNHSLLWKITAPKNGQVSYLFGTIHVWEERIRPIFEEIKPYLLSCELFAAESHLEDIQEMSTESFFLPDNQKLSDFYPTKKYEKLTKQVKKITHSPISNFEHLTPFVLVGTISNILLEKGHSGSLDEHLWDFAKANEKEMFGIESAKEQYEYYQKMPFDDQAKQLIQIAKNTKKYRQNLNQMLERYLKQDIIQLYKNSKKGTKSFRQMMIYERNSIMSDRISNFAKQNTIFVAIGAGHLSGQKGVLNLLKQNGFSVNPIKIL